MNQRYLLDAGFFNAKTRNHQVYQEETGPTTSLTVDAGQALC